MVLNVNAIGAHPNLPDHLPACSAGDPCSIARSLPYDLLLRNVSLMRCVCGVLPVYAAKILLDLCGSCKQQVHVHATKKEVPRRTLIFCYINFTSQTRVIRERVTRRPPRARLPPTPSPAPPSLPSSGNGGTGEVGLLLLHAITITSTS